MATNPTMRDEVEEVLDLARQLLAGIHEGTYQARKATVLRLEGVVITCESLLGGRAEQSSLLTLLGEPLRPPLRPLPEK